MIGGQVLHKLGSLSVFHCMKMIYIDSFLFETNWLSLAVRTMLLSGGLDGIIVHNNDGLR